MKKHFIHNILFLALSLVGFQASAGINYDWEKTPYKTELTDEEKKEPSVYLRDINKIHFDFDKSDNLEQFVVRHYTISLNNIKGVEDNNQVYIPLRNAELIEAKARVIKKDGSITLLNKSNIKEAKEVEGAGAYKYFAIEGAEEGSLIEVLIITKKSIGIFGQRENVQVNDPIKNYEFELTCPKNLFFGFKTYNGLQEVSKDSLSKTMNRYFLSVKDIKPLEDEKYAFSDINSQFLVYRLESNSINNAKNITSFNNISGRILEGLSTPLEKGGQKKLESIISSLKLSPGNTLANIRKFEDYIKANYQILEEFQPEFDSPDYLLNNKVGTESAVLSLFIQFLKHQNIKYEVGVTCDRTEKIFDPKFEAYYFLDEYFIYLPDEDTYVAPSNMYSRIGYLPAEWTGSYALLIRPVTLGSVTKGVGRTALIPYLPVEKSYDKLYVTLKPTEDFSAVKYTVRKEMMGYSSAFQPVFKLFNPEGQKKISESLMRLGGEEDKIISSKVSNFEAEDVFVKPMIVEAEAETENLVEKAGNKFILKVGTVIGQQVEMFQEKPRQQPIQLNNTHEYFKDIRVEIPAGYKIKNPEALVFNVQQEIDGKKVFGFVSEYKIEGNTLIVKVHEYYNFITLPIEYYKVFEDVVNAAANFFEASVQVEKI